MFIVRVTRGKGNGWSYPLECNCWEIIEGGIQRWESNKSKSRRNSIIYKSFDSVEDMKVFLKDCRSELDLMCSVVIMVLI